MTENELLIYALEQEKEKPARHPAVRRNAMDDLTIQEALRALLSGESIEDTDLWEGVRDLESYEEGGYLTYDKGLVFRTADGSEFQLTIRQTR